MSSEPEIKLSTVLSDPKKSSYLSSFQITLNYCDIAILDKVPNRFLGITKLFLSHNKISSLNGIEQFRSLTHLSIGYNQIEDYRELNKIHDKENLKYLMIQGNPLENHPNHKILILEMFPNLEKINNLTVDKNLRETIEKKTGVIQKNIITFLYFLFDEINNLEILMGKLKISLELKTFKFDGEMTKFSENISPQEKLNNFMSSQKNLAKFKNLFDFKRIEELKKFINARKFSTKTDFLSILLNVSEIVVKLYGPFDNKIINNRQAFYTIYKCLYIELIEKLNKRLDKNLEHFLVRKVLSNDLISPQKFSEDDEYALDCMLSSFYQLLPTQAFINDVICYDKKNNLLSPSQEYFNTNNNLFYEKGFCSLSPDNLSNRIYKWENGKEIWKYKRNEVINDLEINENNPENIKNVLLIHFPIFPLNKNYMESILEILNSKFQLLLSFYSEILKLLDGSISLKPPQMPQINEKTMRSQLENEFLERSLDTLRYNESQNQKNCKKFQDKENNTNENWNKEETMKNRRLEQKNRVFSLDKTNVLSERSLSNPKKKFGTLRKTVIHRKNQETSTNNEETLENQKKRKKQMNLLKLCSKIVKEAAKNQMRWSFDFLKRNLRNKKKEAKELLLKKKKILENFANVSKKFMKTLDEKNKAKTLGSLKKFAIQSEKNSILRKTKLKRIFNILFENYANKQKKIAKFYEKMLKCKVFYNFLRGLYNKKKMKESLEKLIAFHRKKEIKSNLDKWRVLNQDLANIEKEKHFSGSSKLKNFFNSNNSENFGREKKDENFNSSNFKSQNQNLSKSYKNLVNSSKTKVCNCRHYFRKCGACESVNFN